MKQNIIVILIVFLGLFGVLWWGKSVQKPISSTPGANAKTEGVSTLSVPETFYDFGKISMKNGNVSKMFRVTNSSDKEINLQSVTTSCMCTVAYVVNGENKKGPFGMPGHGGPVARANEKIPAGESREIEVVYDPNAHGPAGVGSIDRFIYLVDDAGGKTTLEIKALVTP